MSTSPASALYDVAVIGGGIAGAGVARDAALRGLSVVLLERDRFGSGTSGKSSRLVHGGIRYLELAWNALKKGRAGEFVKNFRFVFASLREARTLERLAPGVVEPLALVIPVYRDDARRFSAVVAGVRLYWALALLSGGGRAPKVFRSPERILEAVPGLRREGLLGGVLLWDRRTDDVGLVRATVESARARGALCLEHARVTRYRRVSGGFEVHAETLDGALTFRAKKLVDATGPWVDRTRALAAGAGGPAYVRPVAGAHVTLRRFLPSSVILQAEDDRVFFVVNFGDTARVGTTERDCRDPDTVAPTGEEIDYLLRALSHYFPEREFSRKDVLSSDAGVRPLAVDPSAGPAGAVSREHALRFDTDGVLHMVGVKLTDHRRAAEEAVDLLGLTRTRSRTARVPL